MATEVIYVRVPSAVKEAAEEHATARGLTLTSAVTELIERGLQAICDEPSVAQLEHSVEELRADLATTRLELRQAELTVQTLEQREHALSNGYRALAERTAQPVGSCTECNQPVSGYDLLVTGICQHCGAGLRSLIEPPPQQTGGLDETEFKVLMGALGLALAMALFQGKGNA